MLGWVEDAGVGVGLTGKQMAKERLCPPFPLLEEQTIKSRFGPAV